MANRPLSAVFAALTEMGYQAESTGAGVVVYFKLESDVEPSYAIFDSTMPAIDDRQLMRALQAAGIDYDAFLAVLEGIDA